MNHDADGKPSVSGNWGSPAPADPTDAAHTLATGGTRHAYVRSTVLVPPAPRDDEHSARDRRRGGAAEAQHHPHPLRRLRLWRLRPLRRRAGERHAHAGPRPHRRRGHDVLLLLRAAKLHARPRRGADGSHPQPQRHDHGGLPGPGRWPAPGRVDARLRAEAGRLSDLLHREVAPGRGGLRAAQRPGLRRDEVCRPLSPERLYVCRPTWFPDMSPDLRAFFAKVTKGALEGNAGQAPREVFKINGQYVNTPAQAMVGIPFFDDYVEKASLEYLDRVNKSTPFFMSINFMKVHQPNLPAPDFIGKSLNKTQYADSVVENDTRIGRIMDKLRALGLDKGNTLVFWTSDNGAWQDVYPDAGYTPFRGTKGTVREGGNRVPALAWMPGKIKPRSRNYDIVGGLDLMATFAALAGVKLPDKDRAGQPIVFDSYDMSPVLFGTGKSARTSWFYFTENELTPGAARVGNYKAVFNLRGDNGQPTGALAVDSNLGWKGEEKYVATVPQVFDLWQDPQERYDIFMNNYTERTWVLVTIGDAVKTLMKTYLQYPPRKAQSEAYSGPITLSQYERFQHVRELLKQEGISIPMPSGN